MTLTEDLTRDSLRVLNRHAVALPTTTDLPALRVALEPLLFDGDLCRDDVAEVCQRIDDLQGATSTVEELRGMAPPSDAEIAEWADGIVYGKSPSGQDVYFDPRARAWRRHRTLGPGATTSWPRDDE